MTGSGEHHYTDLPSSVGHTSQTLAQSESANPPHNNNSFGKFANILLVFGVVLFVASLAFAITRTPETTGSQASTDTLDPSQLADMPESTAFLTKVVENYPRSYNGVAIPSSLYTQADRALFTVQEEKRKKYIINRVTLYYVMRDVLNANSITFSDPGEAPSFQELENALPAMKQAVDQNLLSIADFAIVKAYSLTFRNDDKARAKFGEDLRPKAQELVEKYRSQMESNPSELDSIVEAANKDADLQLLTNGEQVEYFRNYFADLNNVPEQDNYIYDEEFDDILFSLTPNQVSPVLTLNSQAEYLYFVIYPTRIDIKQYQSLKDIIAEKLSLIGF